MTIFQKLIITASCYLITMTVQSQNQHHTGAPLKQGKLPAVKDWFLSTGNWQNDPQLYVREFGTGRDTVIMLHGGWGGEHSEFLSAVLDLENQFHFIFYDQRGSLRSPFPDSLISFDQHIEDVERLRKELNIDKLNIVGHSMGAVLASAYATKYPANIRQLVLLAPAPLKSPIPEDEKNLAQQEYAATEQFLNRPEVAQELDRYNLNRKTPALSSREETAKFRIDLFKRMLYDISKWPEMMGGRAIFKSDVFALTAKTYPAAGWNYVKEFKSQSYPVSIITGDHDFLDFGNGLAKKWVSEVPRTRLSIIKNAGHIIWVDQPNEFVKQLVSHLKR